MCGRFLLTSPADSISHTFDVAAPGAVPPRYNLAPGQPVLVVRGDEPTGPVTTGARHLVAMQWGLVPEWSKKRPVSPPINARMETASEKPSFRAPMKRRRCLVPFNGWYEWVVRDGVKRPHLIHLAQNEGDEANSLPLGAFAGIWSVWHGPDGGDWLESVAILTGPARGPLGRLHHRRPLVVGTDQYGAWLAPHDPLPKGFLADFPFVAEQAFRWRAVSRRVNSPRHDDAACLAAPEKAAQGSLF
ncbi:SOS response-associated peptidase [Yunchengibacter salinarum]|uniref:SOS response-associated peptidase n=1 Tax=Yunchengibacter salinarum TaxID=3133399 RepID=UPI0035B65BA4